MAKRKVQQYTVATTSDGEQTETVEEVEMEDAAAPTEIEPASDGQKVLSFARARMEARRKAKEAAGFKPIQPHAVCGEEWFIKALSASEMLTIPMFVQRRDGLEVDFTQMIKEGQSDDRMALTAAIIFVSCVCGENDLTPAFATTQEVWEQLDEAGDDEFSARLLDAIVEVNPKLFPNLLAG